MQGTAKNLGLIGLAVLTFIWIQTERQTDKQTDGQVKKLYR